MTQLNLLNWINKFMSRQQGSGIGVISTPITENIEKVRFSLNRGPRDNEYLGLWGKNFFGIDNFYGNGQKLLKIIWLIELIDFRWCQEKNFFARYPSNLIFTTYCTTCGKELLSISADIRCDWATASLRATLSLSFIFFSWNIFIVIFMMLPFAFIFH